MLTCYCSLSLFKLAPIMLKESNQSNSFKCPLLINQQSNDDQNLNCDIKDRKVCKDKLEEDVKKANKNIHDSTSSNSFILESVSSRQYSRSHQRRFHRRFPAIEPLEPLIDWYNCALISDILLQGYLYISENYFAFYSNILGYKTQLLIPISDVISVTKEKTAKIFPNAVGICTEQAKYVFGSLISREATYKLMQDVWKNTLIQDVSHSYFDSLLSCDKIKDDEVDISIDKSDSEKEFFKKLNTQISSKSSNRNSSSPSPSVFYSQNLKDSCESSNLVSCNNINFLKELNFNEATLNQSKWAVAKDKQQCTFETTLDCRRIKNETTLHLIYKRWQRCHLLWNDFIFKKSWRNRLLVLTAILITLMVISVVILLYKIDQTHNKLVTFKKIFSLIRESDKMKLSMDYSEKKVEQVISLLQAKIDEISILKSTTEDILRYFRRLSTFCN